MPAKRHNRRLGTTAGCVRRLLESALRYETKEPEHQDNHTEEEHNLLTADDVDFIYFDDIDKAREAARRQGMLPPRGEQEPGSSNQMVSALIV